MLANLSHVVLNLFDAPKGSFLVHACNSQGVWGSGIARPFKSLFPLSFAEYNHNCIDALSKSDPYVLCGNAIICPMENEYYVGCLITSFNYGEYRDSKDLIKLYTFRAVESLCKKIMSSPSLPRTIYSNKFNSGLFAVPWVETEAVLVSVLKDYPDINWIVCSESSNA